MPSFGIEGHTEYAFVIQLRCRKATQQMTAPATMPMQGLRRTTYRVPPFADDVVRAHAAQLSRSMGGTRVTYTQALVSLLAIAASQLGIAADHGESNVARE
jgi:hypothetical protein